MVEIAVVEDREKLKGDPLPHDPFVEARGRRGLEAVVDGAISGHEIVARQVAIKAGHHWRRESRVSGGHGRALAGR